MLSRDNLPALKDDHDRAKLLNWKAQTNGQGQSLTTTWLPVHSYSFEGLATQRLRVRDHSDFKRSNRRSPRAWNRFRPWGTILRVAIVRLC